MNRRSYDRLLWVAAIALPIFAVVAAILAVRTHDAGSRVPAGAVIHDFVATPVGEDRPAPSFDLPSLVGSGRIDLARYRGRLVVLNIWASWCDPCRRDAAALEAVARQNPRVVVLGVDHEDGRADALSFRRRFGLTYPIAFDANGSVASAFGAVGLPTTYFVDPNGRVRFRLLGRVTTEILESLISRLSSFGW